MFLSLARTVASLSEQPVGEMGEAGEGLLAAISTIHLPLLQRTRGQQHQQLSGNLIPLLIPLLAALRLLQPLLHGAGALPAARARRGRQQRQQRRRKVQ